MFEMLECCQLKAWPEHKLVCKEMRKQQKMEKRARGEASSSDAEAR